MCCMKVGPGCGKRKWGDLCRADGTELSQQEQAHENDQFECAVHRAVQKYMRQQLVCTSHETTVPAQLLLQAQDAYEDAARES